jgi:3-(3-hydroxy-phenyl)propionate hydroxylase/6-hydroxy-3-succinoylpyridine 3-monooxygenase
MNNPEVIIVGGGPVGLIAALGLARAGVAVQVLDASPEPSSSPRALVYHWAVLEGLERLGLLDEVIEAGVVKQDYSMKVFRTGETIRWNINALEGRVRHPFNVHLGQHMLARIVLKHLERMPNVEVRWGVRVEDVRQNGDGVELSAGTPAGTERFTASWVVASDGGRSTLRSALGLKFEGMTWPKAMVATNIVADLESLGFDRAVFVIDEAYGAIVVKIDNRNCWRVTYCEPDGLPEEGIVARMPGMFEKILPGLGDRYELLQYSPYRMHQRVADRFRVGRVLLAGDAAHLTNPVGGLGLTAGLFDAYALSPALAAVVQGKAPESVLDRYAELRRTNFVEIASPQAVENNRLLFYSDDEAKLEQDLQRVRRLQTDVDAVLGRTLFVGKLETPSLLP